MIYTTIESYTNTMIYNTIFGGCKVVVEIIGVMKNLLDFDKSGFK